VWDGGGECEWGLGRVDGDEVKTSYTKNQLYQ